ncbi:MAG: helix-turn-helix domain-containing protein [Coriobacteriia bacterium]|nr:helix-turn-helix domain-containing protein [Coriobacteriia bacterium]
MSNGLRTRHSEDMRRLAADLFDRGHGYMSAATILGIPKNTVEKWYCTHRAFGLEGLLIMGAKHSKYTYEQKLAAVRAVVDDGVKYADAMAAYGIASLGPLQAWCRAYRKGGAEALRPKPKGRPRGSAAKPRELTREQELEIRVRKLEAENAYLKKLGALRAEETLRTGSKPRW